MCLGIPGRIVAREGGFATVDFLGARRRVRLHLLEEPVDIGDHVLCHVGAALRRLPSDEAHAMQTLFERLLEADERIGSG